METNARVQHVRRPLHRSPAFRGPCGVCVSSAWGDHNHGKPGATQGLFAGTPELSRARGERLQRAASWVGRTPLSKQVLGAGTDGCGAGIGVLQRADKPTSPRERGAASGSRRRSPCSQPFLNRDLPPRLSPPRAKTAEAIWLRVPPGDLSVSAVIKLDDAPGRPASLAADLHAGVCLCRWRELSITQKHWTLPRAETAGYLGPSITLLRSIVLWLSEVCSC